MLRILLFIALLLPLLARAVSPTVAAGGDFSLFLAHDGSLLAAGADDAGQLGQRRALTTRTPVAVRLAAMQQMASRARHNLALDAVGAVWVWGANDEGQLGDGTRRPLSLPQKLASLATAATATVWQRCR